MLYFTYKKEREVWEKRKHMFGWAERAHMFGWGGMNSYSTGKCLMRLFIKGALFKEILLLVNLIITHVTSCFTCKSGP